MANYDFSSTSLDFPKPSSQSSCTASLPPPFISVPNIYNFRHLGTHTLPDGGRSRTDLIFRSAEPSRATSEGTAVLAQLGVKTIYDLRSASEIERNAESTPVTIIAGTERIAIPVFGPTSTSDHTRRMGYYGEEGSGGFVKAYADILDSGKDAYRRVFEHIRDRPSEPMLVHCTAGKDRTGVLVALALGILGVSDEEIAEEYALTEQGLAEWRPAIIEAILQNPVMGGNRAKVERMLGAPAESMLAFLKELRSTWGGPEGYLRTGLGFADEDVQKIKINLTEAER